MRDLRSLVSVCVGLKVLISMSEEGRMAKHKGKDFGVKEVICHDYTDKLINKRLQGKTTSGLVKLFLHVHTVTSLYRFSSDIRYQAAAKAKR